MVSAAASDKSAARPVASRDEIAIRVSRLGKAYRIWDDPAGRLKAPLLAGLAHAMPPGMRGRDRLRSKACSYYRDFRALDDCSFEVRRGETFGIVGQNGAGKSTLLQLIAGTLTPTSGEVEVRGRVAALLELGSGFDPNFTGVENVFLNGSILGLSEEIRARFDEIAEFADIGDFIHQPVRTYSSGMVVRLAFAISVCVDPQVLIIDEALAVGDNYFVNKCFHRLNELKARGVTILFVSHAGTVVTSLCSRALLLDKGSTLMVGDAEEVVSHYNQLIREKQSADVQRLGQGHTPAAPADGAPAAAASASALPPADFSADKAMEQRCAKTRFGNGAARIVRLRMEDTAGTERAEFVHGQNVVIKFYCEFHEEVDELVIGYFCRTDTGINITGSNTQIEGIKIPRQSAGNRALMLFHTTLPVRPGIYSLTMALTGRKGADPEVTTFDWVDLACSFSVHLAPNQPPFEQQVLIPHDFEFHLVGMITLAQIGCGYWGPNLLRNFTAQKNAWVKYVVEPSEERRRYVRDGFPRTAPVDSIETVMADPDVQALVIATPARTHFALADRGLRGGRHVFVEKPLALSVAEADALAAAANERKLTLMVGHTFLYNPAVLFLKQLIDSGELGRIYYLYSQRLNLGVVRSDVNALWNLAPHDVSIFNFLLGPAPVAVTAHGTDYLQKGIEDVVFASFEYPDQVRASLQVSWLDPNKVRKVTLVGSRKMAVYDDMAEDKVAIYDKGIDTLAADSNPLPFDQPGGGRLVYRSGEVRFPKIASAEPLRAEAADFLEAIAEGRPPHSGAGSGRGVVAALQAASLSLKENSRRVRLDEILSVPPP